MEREEIENFTHFGQGSEVVVLERGKGFGVHGRFGGLNGPGVLKTDLKTME